MIGFYTFDPGAILVARRETEETRSCERDNPMTVEGGKTDGKREYSIARPAD